MRSCARRTAACRLPWTPLTSKYTQTFCGFRRMHYKNEQVHTLRHSYSHFRSLPQKFVNAELRAMTDDLNICTDRIRCTNSDVIHTQPFQPVCLLHNPNRTKSLLFFICAVCVCVCLGSLPSCTNPTLPRPARHRSWLSAVRSRPRRSSAWHWTKPRKRLTFSRRHWPIR